MDPTWSFAQFVWLWNHHQGRTTPVLHRQIARWLDGRWTAGDRRLLLMVFRDAGKSTLVGLFCAWLLWRNPNLRLLVMSAEAQLATKMARNVRRIIERHILTGRLRPERPEQWAADAFTVERALELRDPSLVARGIGGNITGSRADVVICDDVEVPNTCDTPHKREELRERLHELSFVLVPGGTMLYVGTPHAFHSIYADQVRPELGETRAYLDGYKRLVLPIVDANGVSRWPERFTPAAIEERKLANGPAKFRSQMLLVPTHIKDVRLDPEQLVRYEGELVLEEANGEVRLGIGGQRMRGVTCVWDPAFGRPDRGDASVIAAVFHDGEGGYWLHAIRYMRTRPTADDPDAAAQLCRQVVAFAVQHEIPILTVESNGLGQFLPGILRRELATGGHAIRVDELISTRGKDDRILDALDPLLASSRLRAHARIWATPFIDEMREWLPGGRGRDDGLDAVAACVRTQPVRPGTRAAGAKRPSWSTAGPTLAARTDFTP